MSELVDEAARQQILDDQNDLQSFSDRASDSEVTYQGLLEDLKKQGRV